MVAPKNNRGVKIKTIQERQSKVRRWEKIEMRGDSRINIEDGISRRGDRRVKI